MKEHKPKKKSKPLPEDNQLVADQAETETGRRLVEALVRARKERFLREFKHHKVVAIAARRIGIDRRTVYKWTADDEEFKDNLTNLQEEIIDQLEKVLHDLATGKLERPLVSAGKLVAYEKIYDGRALEMLLKAYRPKLYRERSEVGITSMHTEHIKIEKKEVTVHIVTDAAKLLLESGAVGSEPGLRERAGNKDESVDSALALAKATRIPKPAA